MIYDDFYSTTNPISNALAFDATWLFISAVLAIVGGISFYILFVSNDNKEEYKGFWAALHKFLNFQKFYIEDILKVLYTMVTIYITLSSFSFISTGIAAFFLYLVIGNISARCCFELLLMFTTLVKNTTEINKKLSIKQTREKTHLFNKKKEEKQDFPKKTS